MTLLNLFDLVDQHYDDKKNAYSHQLGHCCFYCDNCSLTCYYGLAQLAVILKEGAYVSDKDNDD